MREIAIDGFHVFIITLLLLFVVLSILGLTGRFDHWTTRFTRHAARITSRIRGYFVRKHKREQFHHDR